MRIRMIPISYAFNRFPRLVHDLSAKLGKQVELKMTGEQTELDKTVMEKIGDPLVHLVRNALDHGIETPAVRRATGKPETGTLLLNAYHRSGHIVIEITDDGAGLPREKILHKARERGLIKDDTTLPDDKLYDLIFVPGFSTVEQVSDVSGRAVGMDVVRKNITAARVSTMAPSPPVCPRKPAMRGGASSWCAPCAKPFVLRAAAIPWRRSMSFEHEAPRIPYRSAHVSPCGPSPWRA